MKSVKKLRGSWKLSVVSVLVVGGAIACSENYALSQIPPIVGDNTLGAESSQVTSPIPGVVQIDGGATRGANLFHSFSLFSVPSNGIAYFKNALTIQNIISRVTGGSVSNIDGLIAANGTANLFLINPNGIIFSSNASLDIGGSFIGTTASSINFADGTHFSATNPQTPPLLSVNVPLGLQYGANAGSIQLQGSTLQVPNGKTLALVGSNVQLNNAALLAQGGRVELGGVAGTGTVGLSIDNNDLRLSFPDGVALSDVSLTNGAIVDVTAGGGGSIAINVQNLNMAGESQLLAGIDSGLGSIGSIAGDIEIKATGAINLAEGSFIDNSVLKGGVGTGGNINITTRQLLVSDGAQVSASTLGEGKGGDLIVKASEKVQAIGTSADGRYPSDLLVETRGTGTAGNLKITTPELLVSKGANVSATTWGEGKGGNLIVNVSKKVQLTGTSPDGDSPSALFAATYGIGAAGKLEITTSELLISEGADVSVSSFGGSGNAGNLIVNASDSVQLSGSSANGEYRSGLFARTEGPGAAGNLQITTKQLLISNGARVSASTDGSGKGGNLIVNASELVQLIGTTPNGRSPSGLLTETRDTGEAGNLEISTRQLQVFNGAQVSASTFSSGKGGSLIVNASDSVQASGTSATGQLRSGLFAATASNSTGNGGSINISTNNLDLINGAVISAQSLGNGKAGGISIHANQSLNLQNGNISAMAKLSDAGNIEVSAPSIRLENATIRADTSGGQGNINLNSVDLVLRHGSKITTNATGLNNMGGNITIDSGVLAALEDSDITANSTDFRGGNVNITAQGIFGTQFRPQLTPESDITATGANASLNGTVQINTPDVDPTRGLAELPVEPVNVEVAQGCQAAGKQTSIAFFNTGKGGLAANPYEPLGSSGIWEDVPPSTQRAENPPSAASASASPTTPPNKIMEAQGWLINEKGEVVLVAEVPTTRSQGACRLR
ncbi:MAG TPA: S-layer family protein [Coleofasciculaceae cyanobacterium]